MNFEHLKKMTREQLLEVAGKQGLAVHWKAKPETIIKQIMEAVLTPQPSPTPELQHPAQLATPPVVTNTPEQIEDKIRQIKDKVPEFTSEYNMDENTVHFRCKGAEECLNMSIPMRVILMKAQTISRGRLRLMGLTEHFDKTTATGNSSYTNVVLA